METNRESIASGPAPGQVIVLNGMPRSGKTSIARVIQATFPGVWMYWGVDTHKRATPPNAQPGVGLRPIPPGQGSVSMEDWVPVLFAALFDSVAVHARHGLNVVMDVGLHDQYSKPRGIRADCARRLSGLSVLFVGVRCPLDVVWQRRAETWGQRREEVDEGTIAAVELGQWAVHAHSGYDIEVDTSTLDPESCAETIRRRFQERPGTKFAELQGVQVEENARRLAAHMGVPDFVCPIVVSRGPSSR